jgi:serine/threonine protein phosphatase PrpC
MRIEVGAPLTLADFDTVVVASDGLWDNLYAEEIIDKVRIGDLHDCATALMAAAQKRIEQPGENSPSKIDDVTFALFRPKR